MRRPPAQIVAAAVLGGWVLVAGHAGPASAQGDSALEDEVAAWRRDRLERLRSADGWLTLAGLSWLHEGANSCGSDAASDVVLPASAPARVGVFHLADGKVVFEAGEDAGVRSFGKPVGRLAMTADLDGAPTLLEIGTVLIHVIRRQDRLGVRIKDAENPARLQFHGIEYFPIDADWRIEARFEAHDPPKRIPVPNVLGTTPDEASPGAAVFEHAGETFRLDVLEGADDSEVFVVFGDETNGKESYGGGRFLYADLDGDRVVLDFNKSYNPPCAFTPYATCPLPPRQNRLATAIRAGEKKYGDGHP